MQSSVDMRNHIKEVFLTVTEQNNYQVPSVSALCKAACINRSTFYFYFESIDTLLNEVEYDYISQIPFYDSLNASAYGQVLKYVLYVRDHRQVFFILIKTGRLVNEFLKKAMSRSVVFNQRKLHGSFDIDKSNMLSAYTTVGSLSLLETWLTYSPEYSPEKVASFICHMAKAASEKQF